MNVGTWLSRSVLAACMLALAAFSASQADAWVLVVAGSVTVAGFTLSGGPRGLVLPAWAVRLSVLGGIAWGALEVFARPGAEDAARAVGLVVAAGICVKAWDRRVPSDWRQVLVLAMVLCASAALHSSDFLVGALVIAFAAALVPAAMLLQLHAGGEAVAAARRAAVPAGRRAPALESPLGAASARGMRRVATVGALAGIGMSLVVFAVFPRELAGDGGGRGRVSGFRPTIDLWSGGRISQSSRVAMTVRLLDPQDRPGELTMPLRMRGAVLDSYDPAEARWSGSGRFSRIRRFRTEPSGGFEPLSQRVREERSNVWTQEVQMRSLASDRVFSAWMPLAIACDETRIFGLDRRTAELVDIGGGRLGRPGSYRIRMQAFPSAAIVQAVLPSSTPFPAAGDVGFPVPRVGEIAARVLAEQGPENLPTDAEIAEDPSLRRTRARRIAAFFESWLSGGGFRYSTDLSAYRRGEGDDPIVQFLDVHRAGHCELFASAMAALCLASGVEARVVTGFIATEYDGVSDRYVFRESGAHAWVEVRVDEFQWMTFDPSPLAELLAIQQANRTWLDGFRWILDPVEFTWNSRFAGFDARAQAELADRAGEATRAAQAWLAARARDASAQAERFFMQGAVGVAWVASVAGTLAAVGGILAVLAARGRRAASALGARGMGPVARIALARDAGFYLEALRVLDRAGVAKPAWRTPLAHAHELRLRSLDASEAFEAIVRRLYAIRFGGVRPTRGARREADDLVAELRRALADGYTR